MTLEPYPIGWTEWTPLEQRPDYRGAALYEMRLVLDGKPYPIPRMLAVDEDALLMVGETGGFRERYKKFVRATKTGRDKHSEGRLWHIVMTHSPLADRLAVSVQYRYAECPTKEAAQEGEDLMLMRYVMRYGEPPPLNCTVPERDNADAWRECRGE